MKSYQPKKSNIDLGSAMSVNHSDAINMYPSNIAHVLFRTGQYTFWPCLQVSTIFYDKSHDHISANERQFTFRFYNSRKDGNGLLFTLFSL